MLFCIHHKTVLGINYPKLIWFVDVAIVSQYQTLPSCYERLSFVLNDF